MERYCYRQFDIVTGASISPSDTAQSVEARLGGDYLTANSVEADVVILFVASADKLNGVEWCTEV